MIDTEKMYEMFWKANVPVRIKTNGQGTYLIESKIDHPVRKQPLHTAFVEGIEPGWKEVCAAFIKEWKAADKLSPAKLILH